ncbi:outer membrane receptor protein [Caulobacter mirabilis]|uniref:Outer membrane receptor protein n=1 Tax=Caulobacter mirabilis TaxID=69666 RepID=A0A2D2B0R5_9CAUL|nr:outer membrane receptor protein [Caulobacter mirabilis]
MAGAALTVIAGPAIAQSAASSETVLEQIVVTASKRETNLMDTPVAISAFSQESLDRQGIQSARDLAGTIPNLQLGTGSDSGTAATIRGVTSTDFTEVGEGAVAILQDGFYSPRPQGALALMYDVERVEVLRGPQGTLFGMNSPGGAINIIPARPTFGETFGSVEGLMGNYNKRQIRGSLNWGVTDTFALRAAFMAERADGMIEQEMDLTDIEDAHSGIVKDGIPDVDQRRNRHLSPKDWYNNSDQWAFRLIGRWQATEKLELTGTFSYFSDQGAGDMNFVDCEQAAGTVNACTRTLRYAKVNVPGKKDLTIADYQLKAVYDLTDNIGLEYRTSYQDQKRYQIQDVDGGRHAAPEWSSIGERITPEEQLMGYYPIWDESWETKHSRYETVTHELQIKSRGDSRLQYVAGAYYLHEKKSIRYDMEMLAQKTYYEDPGLPLGFYPDGLPDTVIFDQNKRTTSSRALYGQVDYRLTEQFGLTAGYRYSWDKKTDEGGVTYGSWWGNEAWYNGLWTPNSIRAHQSNNLKWGMGGSAPLNSGVLPATAPNHSKMEWSQGTYRLGAQWFPNDDHMMFASVATGHKMGGMYEMTDTCANGCMKLLTYQPEKVTTYELGYKGTLLDGRFRLSVTAFFSDYSDMQNTGNKVVGVNENPLSPNFGDPVYAWATDNLTKSRIHGLEVEFDVIPWDDGRLSGYLAYLHTEITDGGTYSDGYACNEREYFGQPHCGDPSVANIKGNKLPFAPEWSLTVNYQHSIHLPGGFELVPYVSVHWQDRMFLDIGNYTGAHLGQYQDAYWKLNASLRLNGPENLYFVEAFGENLTDEDTKNFGGFNQGMVRNSYDAPLTWGVRLGYSF